MPSNAELQQEAQKLFELQEWPSAPVPDLVYFRVHLQSWEMYREDRDNEDFIARVCTLFGRPTSLRYALRDRETGLMVSPRSRTTRRVTRSPASM